MAVPQNEITRSVTAEYLAGLDPKNPPTPAVIEQSLIDLVNNHYVLENAGRRAGNKIILLKKLSCNQVAQVMLTLHKVVRIAPSGKNTDRDYDMLAIYAADGDDRGVYLTSDDSFRTVARLYNYELSINDFKEIHATLKDAAPRKYRCDDRDLIAVKNGVFDYRTKKLKDFSPELVFLSKSQVAYNAQAVNVTITHPVDNTVWDVESWLAELSDDPEIIQLLWEILGAIIRPHVRWNKSAWFYSEQGNNGKGTLCELMRNLTGPTAYASIPIADFGKDFLLEPLTRASAIIVDENDVGTFIEKSANMKAIITNDVISINRKFKTPIAYQFWGFMVQCLNEFPKFKDKSESSYRRQLFVPFTKCFTGVERKYIKDDYLHRDDVLEYVLKRVLNMNYYALSEPMATQLVMAEFKRTNDPVRDFFSEFEDEFAWDLLPFPFLYDLYRSWFAKNSPSGSPIGRNTFIKDIVAIVRSSQQWYCTDREVRTRTGKRMDAPEPLSVQYDLKDWVSKTYTGANIHQRGALSQPADSYRGLLRTNPRATHTAASNHGSAFIDPPSATNKPQEDTSDTNQSIDLELNSTT